MIVRYMVKYLSNKLTSFNYYSSSDLAKIKIGTVLRLCIIFENGNTDLVFVKLIRLDKYKYGGIHKTRKFVGEILRGNEKNSLDSKVVTFSE